jgi:hypothetical protein
MASNDVASRNIIFKKYIKNGKAKNEFFQWQREALISQDSFV